VFLLRLFQIVKQFRLNFKNYKVVLAVALVGMAAHIVVEIGVLEQEFVFWDWVLIVVQY
jgi:hypothetical protein